MMKQALIIAGALMLLTGAMAAPASAQRRVLRRYVSPSGQPYVPGPFAPYNGQGFGGLGGYYTPWLQSQRQERQDFQTQQDALSKVNRRMQLMDRRLTEVDRTVTEGGAVH